MSESKYPTRIEAFALMNDGAGNRPPVYNEIFYTHKEWENFFDFLRNQKTQYQIKEFKPKLKELTRLNFFEKLSYVIPFKTQLSDILVDIVKIIIGIIIGLISS